MLSNSSLNMNSKDVLFYKTLLKFYSEKEIIDIVTLLTIKDIEHSEIDKLDIFFLSLSKNIKEDLFYCLINFCDLFELDIDTILPVLRKTSLMRNIRCTFKKQRESELMSLF